MHKLPQPVKLWYWGPFFRHEAPQAGRYRQFNQVGVEAIGSDDPSLDAEAILLLYELLERVGAKGVRLRLSSLGTPDTRRAYSDELREYLRGREGELSDEVRGRLDANPLRAFDSDHPGTQAVVRDAPKLLDRLNAEDAGHFAEVRALLDDAGREYEIDPALVRGIDYYTRTVFEFTSDALGAQSGVGGGGRYDGLVEQLGGPHTPGVGWAAGIERILLVADGLDVGDMSPDVYVVRDGEATIRDAAGALRTVREAGYSAQMEQAGRSLKGQLKQADRIGARATLILGVDGVAVKEMSSGEQREAPDVAAALDTLKEMLA
jgi:histidyl-tRNA synthetase